MKASDTTVYQRQKQREARHGQAMAAASLHLYSLGVKVARLSSGLYQFVEWADHDTLVFRPLRQLLEQSAKQHSDTMVQLWHSLASSDSAQKSGSCTL